MPVPGCRALPTAIIGDLLHLWGGMSIEEDSNTGAATPRVGWNKRTRYTVNVVLLSILGLLGGTAAWYWYTHIHIQQPALHDVRCEWKGNQVRVSAAAYNPNGTARFIGVRPTYQLANNRFIENRHLTSDAGRGHRVPAHGTARWSVQGRPHAGVWHTGQAFAACNPTAFISSGHDD